MTKWLMALCAVVVGGALVITDAEARRMGGSRSVGVQRNVTPPPATPKQGQTQAGQTSQAQQGQQAAPQQGAAAAQQPAGSRWGGILGGLALGGLLGYLFAGNGLGGILLIALLVVAAVLVIRALAARRAGGMVRPMPRPMQYAGVGNETVAAPPPSQAAGYSPPAARPAAGPMPANFDSAAFLRAAKMNFVRLQMANDQGNLEEIREFTTDELFQALKADVDARRGVPQHTNVVTLNADLLEVTTEADRHWASVRFSGLVSETPGSEPVGFEEVWNLVKPADGASGWLLAGIQQMH
jgi:predicted lipid-binding transport protein (Tim44 family)